MCGVGVWYMKHYHKLVRNCLRGRPKAQRQFFEEFEGLVMGICLRYAAHPQEAEDMFQEVFIRLYDKLETLRDPQALPAWIKQTSVRTVINLYHAQQKHRHHLEVSHAESEVSEVGNALDALTNEELVNVINQLPERYRLVFNLYVIDGYNHREIGQLLEMTENTSKSHLMRAKAHIKRQLEGLGITRYERYV